MESWKDELYHGLLSNFRSRIGSVGKTNIGRINIGNSRTDYKTSNSSGTGREWKEHKYIRKEGNRYIYPEDLNKPKRASVAVTSTSTSNTGSGKLPGKGYDVPSKKLNTPRSRIKNISGKSNSDLSLRGKGLGTGPVGTGTGRNANSRTITRSNPMLDGESKSTAEIVNEYLYNNSLSYWTLVNAIKAGKTAASKIYNGGKNFISSLKKDAQKPKKPVGNTSAHSILDTPVSQVSNQKTDENVPLDVLIAFNNVLDSYIEEQEKKNK